MRQATLYREIMKGGRMAPQYFFVGFYGNGYPSFQRVSWICFMFFNIPNKTTGLTFYFMNQRVVIKKKPKFFFSFLTLNNLRLSVWLYLNF